MITTTLKLFMSISVAKTSFAKPFFVADSLSSIHESNLQQNWKINFLKFNFLQPTRSTYLLQRNVSSKVLNTFEKFISLQLLIKNFFIQPSIKACKPLQVESTSEVKGTPELESVRFNSHQQLIKAASKDVSRSKASWTVFNGIPKDRRAVGKAQSNHETATSKQTNIERWTAELRDGGVFEQ